MKDKEKINIRKTDHIQIVNNKENIDRVKNYFDKIKLISRALPEIDFSDVDTSTNLLGYELSFPLIISSMTGGSSKELIKINQNLAIAASKTKVGLAVGSQRIIFSNKDATQSFQLRDFAKNIPLISNLGAVQLNYDFDLSNILKAIEVLDADAIYFHLNALQEVIQPEGNTNFKNLSQKIIKIGQKIDKPIFLKEVGCGFSGQDLDLFKDSNIKFIDIAGSGGTSWSKIESFRGNKVQGNIFSDWGISTPDALINLTRNYTDFTFISSGGVRSGIDMLKSIILGASYFACAKPFLKAASISSDEVVKVIEEFKQTFKIGMFLLGIKNIKDLKSNFNLILESEK